MVGGKCGKKLQKQVVFDETTCFCWSEMGDSNSRHLAPKASALPTALIPDLDFEFCARCGQTCGQAVFLTTSTCGGSACIAGVSRDCGHSVFRLEGGATRSQITCATNCATPGYSFFCHYTTASGKNKDFSVCGHLCGQSRFCAVFSNREKPAIACVARLCGVSPCHVPDTTTAHPNRYAIVYGKEKRASRIGWKEH